MNPLLFLLSSVFLLAKYLHSALFETLVGSLYLGFQTNHLQTVRVTCSESEGSAARDIVVNTLIFTT